MTCLRFETPFQNKADIDQRQTQLEAWGIEVTEDFAAAVDDCDALMLEINDPSVHLEYFTRCADLHKPLFLDKTMADTGVNGWRIVQVAEASKTRVFSCTSLRFAPALAEDCAAVPAPCMATVSTAAARTPSRRWRRSA